MQMRSGLHGLSAIPLAYIKREHDTVFLGVQSRRKPDELRRGDQVAVAWRLNTAAYWHGLADANYIWLLPPAGSVLQLVSGRSQTQSDRRQLKCCLRDPLGSIELLQTIKLQLLICVSVM